MLSSSNDGTLRVWDATTGAQLASTSVKGIARVSWSPDDARVLLAGTGEATLRDTQDLHELARWNLGTARPVSVALCESGARAIVGDAAGTVSILDVGREARTLSLHQGPVFATACGRDAWATAGADGRVILGNDDKTRELARRRGPILANALEAGKVEATVDGPRRRVVADGSLTRDPAAGADPAFTGRTTS
jgi:WD40 repeat protein